jgi:hypothetical protein
VNVDRRKITAASPHRTQHARSGTERRPTDETDIAWGSRSSPATELTSTGLGSLQRLIGNHAVAQLVAQRRSPSQGHESARRAVLQRQVTYTPGAGGGPGTFSRVDLRAEEGGPGEGHALERHVDIDDQGLKQRLIDDSAIKVATRWASQADAEATIGAALVAREPEIRAWLAGGASTRAQATTGAAAAHAAITQQLAPTQPASVQALNGALSACGLSGPVFGRAKSALVQALGAIRGDAARAPNPGNAAKIGASVDVATTKINEVRGMLPPGTATTQQADSLLQGMLAPLQAIKGAAGQWATHLEASTRVLVQEVRYATTVNGVTVARWPLSSAGQAASPSTPHLEVISVPEVSLYLYFIDATHFQIRTAFPGSPTSVPAATTAASSSAASSGATASPVTGSPII